MSDVNLKGDLRSLLQNADWKTEKHAPVIDAPGTVKKGKVFRVTATVGKEVAHPNTTPHHIRFITLYFQLRREMKANRY